MVQTNKIKVTLSCPLGETCKCLACHDKLSSKHAIVEYDVVRVAIMHKHTGVATNETANAAFILNCTGEVNR